MHFFIAFSLSLLCCLVSMRLKIPYGIVELYESLARSPWLTVYRALQMASRDEKISLSESNLILQQATIDAEQTKNYL